MTEISYITQNGEKFYLKDEVGRNQLANNNKQIKLKAGSLIDITNNVISKKSDFLKNMKLSCFLKTSSENESHCELHLSPHSDDNWYAQREGIGLKFQNKETKELSTNLIIPSNEETVQYESSEEYYNEETDTYETRPVIEEKIKYTLSDFGLENYNICLITWKQRMVENNSTEWYEEVIGVICSADELIKDIGETEHIGIGDL